MKLVFLFVTGLFLVQQLSAQVIFSATDPSDTIVSDSNNIEILTGINVKQDSRLEKMLRWHIESQAARKTRVMMLIATNQNRAFLYVKFIAPVFRVRVGDFRTKNEALKLLKNIQKDYPGAFIVPDIIDFPVLKSENYERPD